MLSRSFQRLLRDERGATAIEYCLIAALIAFVILGSLGALRLVVINLFVKAASIFP